jgi:hypothetical protein
VSPVCLPECQKATSKLRGAKKRREKTTTRMEKTSSVENCSWLYKNDIYVRYGLGLLAWLVHGAQLALLRTQVGRQLDGGVVSAGCSSLVLVLLWSVLAVEQKVHSLSPSLGTHTREHGRLPMGNRPRKWKITAAALPIHRSRVHAQNLCVWWLERQE